MVKRIFAVLCAVLVVALSVVPCFAIVIPANPYPTWAEQNPDFASFLLGTVAQGNSQANTNQVIEDVDLAYDLGLFGGSRPAAIVYNYQGQGSGFYIEVMTATYVNVMHTYPKTRVGCVGYDYNNTLVLFIQGQYVAHTLWRLTTNGDWLPIKVVSDGTPALQLSTQIIGQEYNQARKLAACRQRDSDVWISGEVFGMNPNCYVGHDTSVSLINPTVAVLRGKYQDAIEAGYRTGYEEGYYEGEDVGYVNGYRQGFANGSPNLLNIPNIFDSMFDGVRSIMTAFDVELFGISIIGTLVAVLVIAIIAFVVRKLWK